MTSAAPLMEPAPAAPKSSLEIMLETIRKRDEQRQNDDDQFLPPSPARPRGRGRPPTTPGRRPLPAGWFKIGNGDGAGTVPVDKRPRVGKGGVTISGGDIHPADMTHVDGDRSHDTESTCIRAEGGFTTSNVIRPAIEIVVDDAMSKDTEGQCMRAKGSGMVADPTPRTGGMDVATRMVDRAKLQDSEPEINVEDERRIHDDIYVLPGGGGGATDACNVGPSVSTTSDARDGCRAPRQRSPSVSPAWSSSGSSSRESSEPEKRTKAGVGKLLSGSTSCVRAPVAAVARMALKICGSGARALEEQTDQEAETRLHVHGATVKSSLVPSGDGEAAASTAKDSAVASSVSRSGVLVRWLKKIFGRMRDVEETTTKSVPPSR